MSVGRIMNVASNRKDEQPEDALVTPWETVGEVQQTNERAFPSTVTTSVPVSVTTGREAMIEKMNNFFSGVTGKIILFVVLATILSYLLG